MGQKTHPIGFRLGISRDWRSRYYAGRELPALLKEDELLRKYLKARLGHAAIADIIVERKPGKVVVTLHTGRPGVVIGKKGAEVDKLRDELSHLTNKEVGINVEEIKRPEIARVEGYHEGRVPLHTLRADIDYAISTAKTTYGTIGVKVWIFKGDIVQERRGTTYSSGQ